MWTFFAPTKAKIGASLIIVGAMWSSESLAGAYHGKVIDADTSEPLSGAVVVVSWMKRPIVTMDGPVYFHDAKEALTDAQGFFSIDYRRRIDLNPFTCVERPMVIVFKPGYEPLAPGSPATKPFGSFDQLRRELLHGTVVKLPRLRPEQADWRKHPAGLVTDLGDVGLGGNTPRQRIPNLLRLIEIQRRRLGLDASTR
jgi:hypothetical protein